MLTKRGVSPAAEAPFPKRESLRVHPHTVHLDLVGRTADADESLAEVLAHRQHQFAAIEEPFQVAGTALPQHPGEVVPMKGRDQRYRQPADLSGLQGQYPVVAEVGQEHIRHRRGAQLRGSGPGANEVLSARQAAQRARQLTASPEWMGPQEAPGATEGSGYSATGHVPVQHPAHQVVTVGGTLAHLRRRARQDQHFVPALDEPRHLVDNERLGDLGKLSDHERNPHHASCPLTELTRQLWSADQPSTNGAASALNSCVPARART